MARDWVRRGSNLAELLEAIAVIVGACTLAILITLIFCHCGPAQVGPFIPQGSPVCDSDAQCPAGQHCAFPAPGYKARCMDGASSIDAPPDESRLPDAGTPVELSPKKRIDPS